MTNSESDDRLMDLLLVWEEMRAAGQDPSAELLCKDCPDLAEKLAEQIRVLRALEPPDDRGAELDTLTHISSESIFDESASRASRYRQIRFLAKGGLGEVFIARDEELNREVALKAMQSRLVGDPQSRSRFLNEAEITGRLEHPGIVPVYGLGHYGDGRPFYAMRFIKGTSLKEAIEAFHQSDSQDRDPGARALELRGLLRRLIDVCNTMAYAHSRGVLHRDLKPANVMLGPYGETLVIDWGLAKQFSQPEPSGNNGDPPIQPALQGNATITTTGSILGTMIFMSPEQAEGDPSRIGPATDVYSLGATLYTILTGKPPYDGGSSQVILKKLREGQVTPPRAVNPSVPRPLDAICLKAMKLKPEERYGSPRDLASDLECWLAGQPVSAWQEPWSLRLRRLINRHRLPAAAASAALLVLALALGYLRYDSGVRAARRYAEANGRVDALLTAEIRSLPTILDQLSTDRALVAPRLTRLARETETTDRGRRLRIALALLPDDPSRSEFLAQHIEQEAATPEEVVVICEALLKHGDRDALPNHFWNRLGSPTSALDGRQLRIAAALARFDPANPRWTDLAKRVAAKLPKENALLIGAWGEAFQPVRGALIAPLLAVYDDRKRDDTERSLAFALLFDYATQSKDLERDQTLVDLIAESDPSNFDRILGELKSPRQAITYLLAKIKSLNPSGEDTPRRQGRMAAALVKLGEIEQAWPLLSNTKDPSARTELIHDLARFQIEPTILIDHLHKDRPTEELFDAILALGEYRLDQIPPARRESLIEFLLGLYQNDGDPGIHGAADWLLRHWGYSSKLEPILKTLSAEGIQAGRNWFVDRHMQTFSIIRDPKAFVIGSPRDEPGRDGDEFQYLVQIPRSYAIATREVTFDAFQQAAKNHPELIFPHWEGEFKSYMPSPECPAVSVNWYSAVLYCNLLNEAEGIPESQWCYPKNFKSQSKIKEASNLAPDLTLSAGQHKLKGYRLPTEAEWEYACRAGSTTVWPIGRFSEMLKNYAWYLDNANGKLHPVGQLKPNAFGLFDMVGNAHEWMQEPWATIHNGQVDRLALDLDLQTLTLDGEKTRNGFDDAIRIFGWDGFGRMKKGGGFQDIALKARPARRIHTSSHYFDLGFRVVRTID